MYMPMQLFPWQFFRVCVPFTDNIIFLSRHFAQFLWKCRIGTVYEAQSLASSEIIFFFVFYFLHQINLTWLVLLGKEDVVGNLSAPCTSVFAILFNVAVYEYCVCFLIFCCTKVCLLMARLALMVEFLVYMFINFTEIKHLLTNKNVLKEDII